MSKKEKMMSKLIHLAALALVLTGASEAMARNRYDHYWVDKSKHCGGYSCNSQEGSRAFWDYEQEQGE
jgi:hypothetical protein